jgi:hypothetical protein
MKLISKLSMLVVMMAMFSFSFIELSDIAGKYGDKASTKMEMTLLENGDFTYTDNSNAESPLVVKGKWQLDKMTITLSDYGSADIPNQWRFDEKSNALKSRKGMTFYRIANEKAKSCCASKGEGKSCGDKK